jgi:DNA invertase Pin-like site-specific DNA recombinase
MMLSTARLNLAYTRKSLKDKTYNTIERDIARFKELGFKEGEIYHDIESGDSDARFNFAEIWSLVLAGKVASLTITRDDRLGRKGSSLLRLYKDMETHNTKLIVLDDGGEVDFTNPYEWIRRADSAIRSEYERRALKSRIEKGINYRRASGKSSGGRAPYGYFRDKKKDIGVQWVEPCKEARVPAEDEWMHAARYGELDWRDSHMDVCAEKKVCVYV